MNIKNGDFVLYEDISKLKNSLLIESDSVIAQYKTKDYVVQLEVYGEVYISDSRFDEVYYEVGEFPDALIQDIKSGFICDDNNTRWNIECSNDFYVCFYANTPDGIDYEESYCSSVCDFSKYTENDMKEFLIRYLDSYLDTFE